MTLKSYLFGIIFSFCSLLVTSAQTKTERWGIYEISIKGKQINENPFDTELTADFINGDTKMTVDGFYDGDGVFKIRFMPTVCGKWEYTTHSKLSSLDNKSGCFECIPSRGNNHGMVKVSKDGYNFAYGDGTRYYPVGTTAYGWMHADAKMQQETMNALCKSKFNKIRMCVFPISTPFRKSDPSTLPFIYKKKSVDKDNNFQYEWDYESFSPAYFKNIEECINRLKEEGIEADLILFNPYDKGRWGFDSMPMDVNLRYLKYVNARLGAYSNVWWSLANEFDLIKSRKWEDWDVLSEYISKIDPYKHLCSIHGSTATYFEYWKPQFTHTSIQDEAPVVDRGRAAIVRDIYRKPVIMDEVCYEGNIRNRWGRLSGQEMLYRMWNGIMAGTYVTHGESLAFGDRDDRFISQGGTFCGESWKRIGFMRDILDKLPDYLQFADTSRDELTSTAGDGYYLIYFGKDMADTWTFSLPTKNASYDKLKAGTKFKVEVIDTWNMKITECPTIFETAQFGDDRYRMYDKLGRKVLLPLTPYVMLRITKVAE